MGEQRSLNFQSSQTEPPEKTAGHLSRLEDLKHEACRVLADARGLGLHDPAAESALAEAERLSIKCADMETQMRAFESSGDFYNTRKAFVTASKKYEIALQNAQCLTGTSDAAVEDL